MEPTPLTLTGFRDAFIVPLLEAVSAILDEAELYGRSMLKITFQDLEQLAVIDDAGGGQPTPARGSDRRRDLAATVRRPR
jgi:hypothetical protein